MKIISASRRTDIPGFYSKWFLNRIQAGFCHWLKGASRSWGRGPVRVCIGSRFRGGVGV
ncbi:DUF1848 family protein, partial [Laspinema olomoucense]|uniref:DUF1848 family protein n=1 Tax=Laspinema olomoucense TaxID=3231600 RepID=UPI00338E0AD8